MNARHAARAFGAVLRREGLRFLSQHSRLVASIVRPLVWLAIFAVGFRSVLGLAITPPYQTYILYETYIVPGLAGMMLLFHGMQTSLSMVYDREMGSMQLLLTAPLPRWFILWARLVASVLVALPGAYLFLLIARYWSFRPPAWGYAAVLPALILSGTMLGAFGLLVSALIRQLENFAGVMNFVIFPMFFASSALYPLWRIEDSSEMLATAARLNPFTHAVELIRFAFYLKVEPLSLVVVSASLLIFFTIAVWGYDPGRGFWGRRAL